MMPGTSPVQRQWQALDRQAEEGHTLQEALQARGHVVEARAVTQSKRAGGGRLAALALGLALTLPLQPAQAYVDAYINPTWMIEDAYRRTLEQNKLLNEQNRRRHQARKPQAEGSAQYRQLYGAAKPGKATGSAKRPARPDAHRYQHSEAVTQQVSGEMVQSLRDYLRQQGRLDAQAEQRLQGFQQAGFVQQVHQALRADGYEPHSLATAMAFWVLVNYGIAQQQDLNRLSMQPLVKQLQTAMAGEQSVAGMDAAQKQRMAETLYWMGSLQLGIYVDAVKTGNTQELNARMHDAKAALRQMGLEGSIRNGSKCLEIG